VLAFPCNQFFGQESGTPEEIRAFVQKKLMPLGVNFTIFQKADVKGPGIHPVYRFLCHDGAQPYKVGWNFHKFLVGPQGQVYKKFDAGARPSAIAPSIQALLGAR